MGWVKVYAEPIGSAAVGFLILCVALALPYLAWQYRRRGTIAAGRTFAQTSFVLYLMCAWALVLMPFPDDPCLRTISPQLEPFHWLRLARSQSTGMGLLTNPNTLMFVFNVALLFPLGVYLRRWFGRGPFTSTAIGFGMSVAFEVTQYTALFGLYECTYRQLNVDDLLANTGGALLGWLLAPLIFIVPRRGEEPTPPATVTIPRRIVSCVLDLAIALGLTVGYTSVAKTVGLPIPGYPFYVALLVTCLALPLVTNGRTPGQFSVGMRTEPGRNPVKQALRWLLVWGCYVAVVELLTYGIPHRSEAYGLASLGMAGLVLLWPFALLGRVHERLSGTRAVPETAAGGHLR